MTGGRGRRGGVHQHREGKGWGWVAGHGGRGRKLSGWDLGFKAGRRVCGRG